MAQLVDPFTNEVVLFRVEQWNVSDANWCDVSCPKCFAMTRVQNAIALRPSLNVREQEVQCKHCPFVGFVAYHPKLAREIDQKLAIGEMNSSGVNFFAHGVNDSVEMALAFETSESTPEAILFDVLEFTVSPGEHSAGNYRLKCRGCGRETGCALIYRIPASGTFCGFCGRMGTVAASGLYRDLIELREHLLTSRSHRDRG